MEIWRDVIGFEGKHQVSNLGNFRKISNAGNLSPTKPTGIKLERVCISTNVYRIDDLIDRSFNRTRNKIYMPVVVFDSNFKLMGLYQSMNAFKRHRLGVMNPKTGGLSNKELKIDGYTRVNNYYYFSTKNYTYKKVLAVKNRVQTELNNKKRKKELQKIRTSTNNLNKKILICDENFNPIRQFNGGLTKLAKQEGLVIGTMKAKSIKDRKIFERYLAGEDVIGLRSKFRYIYMRDFLELTDKYLV